MSTMRLPWNGSNIPHGTLDLLRKCNISCRGCYNQTPEWIKPLQQVKDDLDSMMSQRRLHTVSLTGGEATLHPQLPEIVQHVRSRGLMAAIVTNGVLLDSEMLSRLKTSGVNLIMVHIQLDQKRPDLPAEPKLEDVEELRRRMLQMIADHGIEPGISYIIYRNRLEELGRLLSMTLNSLPAGFVLLTMYNNFNKLPRLQGSLSEGFRSVASDEIVRDADEGEIDIEELLEFLEQQCFRPFSYVAANTDKRMKRWYAYLFASVTHRDGSHFRLALKSSLLERVAIRLMPLLRGRMAFLYKPNPWLFRFQILLNALTGGDFKGNLKLLQHSMKRGAVLSDKHFLLQRAPELTANGEVVFCKDCPDATIRSGKLLPACLADRIVDE
jgi:Radical SAM superfamily/4Fe-4S single cluster domain